MGSVFMAVIRQRGSVKKKRSRRTSHFVSAVRKAGLRVKIHRAVSSGPEKNQILIGRMPITIVRQILMVIIQTGVYLQSMS